MRNGIDLSDECAFFFRRCRKNFAVIRRPVAQTFDGAVVDLPSNFACRDDLAVFDEIVKVMPQGRKAAGVKVLKKRLERRGIEDIDHASPRAKYSSSVPT